MSNKRFRPIVECLENRQLLSATAWFDDSDQALGVNIGGSATGDVDGDGDLDVLTGCRDWAGRASCSELKVWLNDGMARFSEGWTGGGPSVADVALADVDNDGDLDAFLAKARPIFTSGERASEVWFNDGRGNFSDSGQRLRESAIDVAIGDIDGDDDLDALTANVNGLPSNVWLNDGSGHFSLGRQRFPTGWRFALGDLDGDADLDAWFAEGTCPCDHSDRVYLNDGSGNFTNSGQRLNTVSTGDVQLGDLDGDGDLDAYLANGHLDGSSLADRVWLNDGTGAFTDSKQKLGRSNGVSVGLADLDNDGDLDSVVANGILPIAGGAVTRQPNDIWLNDGTGVFTQRDQGLGNAATWQVLLGDLDADGDVDVFFAHDDDDSQIWINVQLIAGDANRDGLFDQLDIVQTLQSAKYQTGQPAGWAEGDFNDDGLFDQLDVIAALQTGSYGQV